jgi:HD-GYP domain-containing protein (c-di-GMP phosphodiesterase class II)
MKYSPSGHADSKTVGQQVLSCLLRAITTVSRQAQPEIFAHVQPHAHATAQLARHVAVYLHHGRGRRSMLQDIEFGARVHDIGKYFISSSILLKPGALDQEERAMMCLHSVYGATVISKLPGITEVIRCVVLHHHERWDGKGYPEGLAERAIPLAARIVSIVDVYTSLRAKRSYKPTLTKRQAFSTLIEMAGHELDPYLVEDFLRLVRDKHSLAGHKRTFV